MNEPTKEQYQRVLDFISYALEHANEVTLQHDAQILVERALRLAANLPSEEEIAISICQSGQFETGQGTCALICMNQLGAPRNKGCCHTKTVHKRLAARILERIRRVK